MKLGKIVIAWDHERELLRRVEFGARDRIRSSLSDGRHPWTRDVTGRVVSRVMAELADHASGMVAEAKAAVVEAVMAEIKTKGSDLRNLLAMLLRSEVRSLLEQRAEDARSAREAANPCVDGYTEHDFGEAGLTSCERCGTLSPDAERVALAAAAEAPPRTTAEQIASAQAAAEALANQTRGIVTTTFKSVPAEYNVKADGTGEVEA